MVKPYVEAGELVAIGVVQEQHPDRARLYKQWRNLDWPIFVDSLNVLDIEVVPIPLAIDASGIIRQTRIYPNKFADAFIHKTFSPVEVSNGYNVAIAPDVKRLGELAKVENTVQATRALGDGLFLLAGGGQAVSTDKGLKKMVGSAHPTKLLDQSIKAYRQAVAIDSQDGRSQFRLGVALRRRAESALRQPGDAQEAVDRWGLALATNPNQYIWRRRIQQYGPRLDKPYNFYFWVEQARKDVAARGLTPVALTSEPRGSEIAERARQGSSGKVSVPQNRDPKGLIHRDRKHLVNIEPVVTPARVQPGHRVQVRVTLRLDKNSKPYWNNESDELMVFLDPPDGVTLTDGRLQFTNPAKPETQETRVLEFELAVDKESSVRTIAILAYALYYVCENQGGKCFYLRQDFTVAFRIDAEAPVIQ